MEKLTSDESDYVLICRLASGRYGDVSKAIHKKTGNIVALKKIKFFRRDEDFSQKSLKEIHYLQRLGQIPHQNIVRLLDVFFIAK